ncbi:CBS domain-containing protein [Methanocella conradii]|uniref:CBS domain-containing protein n=1 Tax=Methanocella conradii TaxID=1175444 RepID=UPI00157DAEFF|nr:CBS domain-containing protein [Methanocella conradii]
MKVKDIMSKARVVDKSARISDALDLMEKYHCRRLIVKNKDGVQGIVTLRSICGALGSRRKYNHPPSLFHVADALSDDYAIVGPEEDAGKALEALKGVGCVIVVDNNVAGQVTAKEVLAHFAPDGTVGAIMKSPIVAPPDARVSHIRKLMMETGVSRVPIMDGDALMGMVSETDVANAMRSIKKHSPQSRQDNNVELLIAMDIMRTNVITATPEMSLKDAAKLMVDKDIGALPVLDGQGRLVGIITRRDIVRAF